MNSQTEQIAFGQRLIHLLQQRQMEASPTRLQRAFNAVSPRQVSVHAARKWLVGESIPAQANLLTLAGLFEVDAQWLRFGGKQEAQQVVSSGVSLKTLEIAGLFNALTPSHQAVLISTARALRTAEAVGAA